MALNKIAAEKMAAQLRVELPDAKVTVEKDDKHEGQETIKVRTAALSFKPWQLAAVAKTIKAAAVEFYRSGTSVSMKIS